MRSDTTKPWLVVSVDTECDKGPQWRTRFPLSFRSVREGIPDVLMPLLRECGAPASLLLSPEVLEDSVSVQRLGSLSGCELGTHLHGEFIEPAPEFDAPTTSAVQFGYGPDVERRKLENLTRLFVQKFGYHPTSFRAGRFGLGRQSLSFLEELGYVVDCSVTPYRRHRFTPELSSDYWGAPTHPYHPSSTDPAREGRMRIWQIPVSTGIAGFLKWPRPARRVLGAFVHGRKRLCRWLRISRESMWIRPWMADVEKLKAWMDRLVQAHPAGKPLVLQIMFHSNEIVPAASPYPQTAGEVDRFLGDLRECIRHAVVKHSARPATLTEVARALG